MMADSSSWTQNLSKRSWDSKTGKRAFQTSNSPQVNPALVNFSLIILHEASSVGVAFFENCINIAFA